MLQPCPQPVEMHTHYKAIPCAIITPTIEHNLSNWSPWWENIPTKSKLIDTTSLRQAVNLHHNQKQWQFSYKFQYKSSAANSRRPQGTSAESLYMIGKKQPLTLTSADSDLLRGPARGPGIGSGRHFKYLILLLNILDPWRRLLFLFGHNYH